MSALGDELAELRNCKELTPESLMHYFSPFTFELGERRQDPAAFLRRRRGDCEDFAGLASLLLAERKYHPKIVVVMMTEQTHVVCYVPEAHGFLDFNHRADPHPIIPSTGTLEDIAGKTADYFRTPWCMASEIRYEGSDPVFLDVAFRKADNPAPSKAASTAPAGGGGLRAAAAAPALP